MSLLSSVVGPFLPFPDKNISNLNKWVTPTITNISSMMYNHCSFPTIPTSPFPTSCQEYFLGIQNILFLLFALFHPFTLNTILKLLHCFICLKFCDYSFPLYPVTISNTFQTKPALLTKMNENKLPKKRGLFFVAPNPCWWERGKASTSWRAPL